MVKTTILVKVALFQTGIFRSRPGKPNQRKGQHEKLVNFAHFMNSGIFPSGKQARFTLNFCSGMPLRKVHELTYLWFGLPGPLLNFGIQWTKMDQNGPFWPKEVYFGPFRSANRTVATPDSKSAERRMRVIILSGGRNPQRPILGSSVWASFQQLQAHWQTISWERTAINRQVAEILPENDETINRN